MEKLIVVSSDIFDRWTSKDHLNEYYYCKPNEVNKMQYEILKALDYYYLQGRLRAE